MQKSNYVAPCIYICIMQEEDVIRTSGNPVLYDGKDNLFSWGWYGD